MCQDDGGMSPITRNLATKILDRAERERRHEDRLVA